jgi:hypothetical protein
MESRSVPDQEVFSFGQKLLSPFPRLDSSTPTFAGDGALGVRSPPNLLPGDVLVCFLPPFLVSSMGYGLSEQTPAER